MLLETGWPESGGGEFLAQVDERHRFDGVREREALCAAVHHPPTLRLHVFAGQMETPLDLRREAALDLYRPGRALTGKLQQQVDLGAGRGTVEVRLGADRRCGDQRFDRQTLPAAAGHRVRQQGLTVDDPEQSVHEAALEVDEKDPAGHTEQLDDVAFRNVPGAQEHVSELPEPDETKLGLQAQLL